ncbi:MAG: hypothetical protein K8R41_01550 [Bacteroidales bacterium]|nr:hypothetical protein [Bacteroidales bacterium]
MKRSIELNPSKENIHIIESFIENVCDYHHISDNYFANIVMAITEASKVIYKNNANENIFIAYDYNNNGLHFSLEGKLDWNELILNEHIISDLDSEAGREIFVIWSMPDKLKISEDGKQILLSFSIDNIDEEKAVDRKQTMKDYFGEKSKKSIKS